MAGQLHQRPVAAARSDLGPAPGGGGGQQPPQGWVGEPRAAAMAPTSWLAHLRADAGTTKLVIPSRAAVAALLMVPLVLWVAVVGAGAYLHAPLEQQEEVVREVDVAVGVEAGGGVAVGVKVVTVQHPLHDFDRAIFRAWGPLLPLLPYALRVGAMLLAAAAQRFASPSSSSLRARPSTPSSPSPSALGGAASSSNGRGGGGRGGVLPTLPLASLTAYLGASGLRVALYLGHLALQRGHGLFLMSDHIFLAASVLACLQCEMVLALSDAAKCEARLQEAPPPPPRPWHPAPAQPASAQAGGGGGNHGGNGIRQAAAVAALVAAEFAVAVALVCGMLLFFVVAADMHFTARHYHHVGESWAALAAGLAVFQLPMAAWLMPTTTATTARS